MSATKKAKTMESVTTTTSTTAASVISSFTSLPSDYQPINI